MERTFNDGIRTEHSLYVCLGEQHAEEMCQVMRRVEEVDDRTSVEGLVGAGRGGDKHI